MSGLTPAIHLGLQHDQKREAAQKALDALGDVDRIYVFHGDKDAPDFAFDGYDTIYVSWPETEKYRTFYPLLGQPYKGQNIPAITNKSLLVVDEMMMTQKRSVLRYNCTAHFLRVSDRRIVFNFMPFIDDPEDYMILMDFAHPGEYRMRKFDEAFTAEISAVRRVPDLAREDVPAAPDDVNAYEAARDQLFDELGDKDPDTIPRSLILQVGRVKARHIKDQYMYVARNRRIKRPNIITYADSTDAPGVHVLDPTYKRRDLIGFLRRNDMPTLIYMHTGIPVDNVYYDDWTAWVERLGAWYDAADIH